MYKVTLLLGDGVGPEIAQATKKCIDATGVKIDWDVQECGIEVIEEEGGIPDRVMEAIKKTRHHTQSPDHHAHRQGFPQRERAPAARVGTLRLCPALQAI